MNDSYPSSTEDYDKVFLLDLLKAVFPKKELVSCGKKRSLMELNRSKRQFAKDIFLERVGNDNKRYKKFKEFVIEIGQSI